MSENENLQQAADRSSNSNPSLVKVVGLVFLVAFLLLGLAYLMESRTTADSINNLHQSVSSLQTLEQERQTLRDEISALRQENDALEAKVNEITTENAMLQGKYEALQAALDSLNSADG